MLKFIFRMVEKRFASRVVKEIDRTIQQYEKACKIAESRASWLRHYYKGVVDGLKTAKTIISKEVK